MSTISAVPTCTAHVSVCLVPVKAERIRTTFSQRSYSVCAHLFFSDFDSGQPREYLTLKAERSSNYASYYDNLGE